MMYRLDVPTKRGVLLNGVLFRDTEKRMNDTVMIAITGIHGNFYSNPFYYNVGDTLNGGDIDFIYAQTNDAFCEIETMNVTTGQKEIIGSCVWLIRSLEDEIFTISLFGESSMSSSTKTVKLHINVFYCC